MTKADLIHKIFVNNDVSFDATETVVDAVFQAIRDELIAGGKVQIHGFGTFKVETRAAHKGRNIRSGEELTISRANMFVSSKVRRSKRS